MMKKHREDQFLPFPVGDYGGSFTAVNRACINAIDGYKGAGASTSDVQYELAVRWLRAQAPHVSPFERIKYFYKLARELLK